MTVLLVDDDIYSIEGVRDGIHWSKLGVTKVLSAISAEEARATLEKERVDICLCDIEMPGEDGLSLLHWMNEYVPDTVTIYYSSHADFWYARKALEYHAFDYILKPSSYSEIEKVLAKAIEKVREEKRRAEKEDITFRRSRSFAEKFYAALLDGTIPSDYNEICRIASYRQNYMDVNAMRLTILISVRNWTEVLRCWAKIDVEFAIKNLSRELYSISEAADLSIFPYRQRYYLVVVTCRDMKIDKQNFCLPSQRLLRVLAEHNGVDAVCVIGDPVRIDQFADNVQRLIQLNRHHNDDHRVLLLGAGSASQEEPVTLDTDKWYAYLLAEKKEELLRLTDQFFENGVRFSSYQLEQFYNQYTRMIFSLLDLKNIQYSFLFDQDEYRTLNERAFWSAADLRNYIDYLNNLALQALNRLHNEVGTIERVKQLIEERISEELTREELAGEVFLNPDYLSRLFRKETGTSLTEYILAVRMQKAKSLLALPGMTISVVAYQVGYTNLPYFCKVFKRETGVTPSQYKQTVGVDEE